MFIQSWSDSLDSITKVDDNPNIKRRMVRIDPKDLIGRRFLKDLEEDRQRFQARVVCAVVDKDTLKKVSEYMKFIW
jgi:hypothetical protein